MSCCGLILLALLPPDRLSQLIVWIEMNVVHVNVKYGSTPHHILFV